MNYGSSRDEARRNNKKTDGDDVRPSDPPHQATATAAAPRETDPLLRQQHQPSHQHHHHRLGLLNIRSRRTASKSPSSLPSNNLQQQESSTTTTSSSTEESPPPTKMSSSTTSHDQPPNSYYYESMDDRHPSTRIAEEGPILVEVDAVERQRQALSPTANMAVAAADRSMNQGPQQQQQQQQQPSSSSSSSELIPLAPQQQPHPEDPSLTGRAVVADIAVSKSFSEGSSSAATTSFVPDPPPLPHAASAGALELNQRHRRRSLLFPNNNASSSSASFPPPPPTSVHNASPLVAGRVPSSSSSNPPTTTTATTTYGSSSQASHNPRGAAPNGLDKSNTHLSSASASSTASASDDASRGKGGRGTDQQQSHRQSGRFVGRRSGSHDEDYHPQQYHHHHHHDDDDHSYHSSSQVASPILEIPEEVYQVRKAALQVLKPLTKTWVVMSVGFALTVLFGTSRWTRLMPGLPFWFILLPAWMSHAGLLLLHVQSAQNLSVFIASANESRQRGDSRDHINRTEYLPLLQRSLKFGLKTGLLSFIMFCFEILIYVRMAKSSISLSVTFIPLWLLVAAGLTDGIVCKSQHWLRVSCWLLLMTAMVLVVLKVDYRLEDLRWRTVFSPIIVVLSIASGTLIYIVYGHQVGYYRLTESQLTAGNLYSLAALISMVLMIMLGEVIPLSRPVEIESRLFVVILAPLVISLVGMGAWVVSRDEYARLLLYGGQAAVHPMKLRWEAKGWTCVQGRGVVTIPMFGEVSFQPLERKSTPASEQAVELMTCCSGVSCYPYEQDDEEAVALTVPHHYLDPLHPRGAYHQVYRGL